MKISVGALAEILNLQLERQPLIHCISSMVTMSDLSQGISSYNGNPIIASGIEEIGEITNKAEAVVINLGTLDNNQIESMEKSLRIASTKNKPVVLDAVGVDISFFRKEIVLIFLERYKIDVIKGSLSEIKELLEKNNDKNKGIKLKSEKEEIFKNSIKSDSEIREEMRAFSKRYKTILVAKGKENYVTDGFSEFFISNGNERYDGIAGVTSILSGLIAVGIAIARTNAEKVQSVLIAIMTMGISQELVCAENKDCIWPMSLKKYLIDEIGNINNEKIELMGKISYVFNR